MNKVFKLFAAATICALPALPLTAVAQTSRPADGTVTGKVLPADAPRSESERKATQENGQAPNYGQTDTRATDPNYSDTGRAKTRTKRTDKVTKDSQAATGDVPTYPAKTKDDRTTGGTNVKSTPTGN